MDNKIEFAQRLRAAMVAAGLEPRPGVLKVEPEVLRFGSGVRQAVQAHRERWETGVGYLERETFDAFMQLPAAQRKLIREVILAFSKAYGEPRAAGAEGMGADRP